jgi:hypothetical protein
MAELALKFASHSNHGASDVIPDEPEVISVRGVFVHEKDGSKSPPLITKSSSSAKLSIAGMGMVVGDIECLCIRPSIELGVGGQSVSCLYEDECSSSMNIDGVVYAPVDVFECSGSDMRLDILDWHPLLPSDFGLPARDDGLYLQSDPYVRHREHSGRALLHLTFAKKQQSHDSLNLECRGLEAFWVPDILRIVSF